MRLLAEVEKIEQEASLYSCYSRQLVKMASIQTGRDSKTSFRNIEFAKKFSLCLGNSTLWELQSETSEATCQVSEKIVAAILQIYDKSKNESE